METLKKNEMMRIKGGGITGWVIVGIGALAVFLAGVIDGFVNPKKCSN